MIKTINIVVTRLLPVLTPAFLLAGVFVGDSLKQLTFLITWIFAMMTLIGSLNSSFRQFNFLLHHPLNIIIALITLHVLIPVWVLIITDLFGQDNALILTGFILLAATPTGVTSFVWSSIYHGDIPLVLSVILVDTLLSPLVVPLTLKIIVGQSVHIDVGSIMLSLLLMVVLPSLLGMVFNRLIKPDKLKKLTMNLAPFSKLGIFMIVFINGGMISTYVTHIDAKMIVLILTVAFLTITGYLLSYLVGKLFRSDRDVSVTLTFSGGMRNIASGVAIAVSSFSPQTALPVMLGMLFQQVSAATMGKILFSSSSDAKRTSKTKQLRSNYSVTEHSTKK